MNPAGMAFGHQQLTRELVEGRDVLEVGAQDINGSLQAHLKALDPGSFVAVDIELGPGVDRVADVEKLRAAFPTETFDLIIATEVAEHVRGWRAMVNSLKEVLRPGGVLLLTTRSKGFYYHGYPFDFWRYELDDMRQIFGDMEILALESDTHSPGVFIVCRVPEAGPNPCADLSKIELYSIVRRQRCLDVSDDDIKKFRLLYRFRRRFWKIWPKVLRFGIETDWV